MFKWISLFGSMLNKVMLYLIASGEVHGTYSLSLKSQDGYLIPSFWILAFVPLCL